VGHNLFKENYTGPIFLRRVFGFMNQSGRFMNHIRGVGGCEVTPNEFGGIDIHAGLGGRGGEGPVFKFSRFDINGTDRLPKNQIRIDTGFMEGRYGVWPVMGGVVTCGGSASQKHLIIAEGDETGGSVQTNSVSFASTSGDTATKWRRALYRVYLNESNAVLIDCTCAGAWGIVL
jgi:hypothetical protein